MSHTIIDRTIGTKNKSSVNRQKFMKRASKKIKEAVRDYIINDSDIKNISDKKSKNIKIKTKTLDEPQIVFDPRSNDRKQILIGNKKYSKGDFEYKSGGGSGDDPDDEGGPGDIFDDEFYFTLTHDEFIDLFFDDLELPFLIKKQLKDAKHFELYPAGYTNDGPPNKLDLRKTMVNSLKRTFAVLGNIEEEIEKIQKEIENSSEEVPELKLQLEQLLFQKENIPFIQELDLRYRKSELKPIPSFKCVMFCLLDISGSMTEWHKEVAKRFFMLLHLFLNKNYETVELVFIKHHHEAQEVDEKEFFYSRESGGTVVSTAFQLMKEIIDERYDTNLYNIYVCQASDGDNMNGKEEETKMLNLLTGLMPKIQYFAYIEIEKENEFFGSFRNSMPSSLMKTYNSIRFLLSAENKIKFNIRHVDNIKGLFQVFRSLFVK